MAILDLLPKLKGSIPSAIYDQLPGVLPFGIDGPKRLSHFLGQAAHESMGFTVFTENLNYSAKGLLATFPKYFDIHTAAQYERKPQAIANHVYANRLGNSNEVSGDGWRHRGMGCIQLTGKSNQGDFFESMGLPRDSDPQLIATTYQMASAAWFFKVNNLWIICDKGVSVPVITELTHRINGGEIGLSERIRLTQHFYQLLTT